MINTKKYWNKVSETKNFTHPLYINEIEEEINNKSKILDVGRGYGRTLNKFYKLGYNNLTGIDISKNMLERGKKLNPNIKYKLISNNKILYKDNGYDCIILFAVLTCIINNNEQEKIISEIFRVLKPNGIVYISDYLINNDSRNKQRYEKHENKYNNYGVFELEDGGIVRHHDKKWIKQLTSIFDKIKYNEVIYSTMNGNESNGFYYIGKKND